MNHLKLTALTGLIIAMPGLAHASDSSTSSKTYLAVGATSYNFDTYGAEAKLGYKITDNVGVELQGTIGLTEQEITTNFSSNKVDHTIAGFATASLPVSDNFDIFVRGGYHTTQRTYTQGLVTTFNEDGLALGVGGQYNLDTKNGVRVEYTYLDSDVRGFDTYAISYVRNF